MSIPWIQDTLLAEFRLCNLYEPKLQIIISKHMNTTDFDYFEYASIKLIYK
jgi:hypothetical protein